MEGIIIPLGLGLLAVVAAAVVVAVVEHRKRIAEMQKRLAWSEESRFAMEQHAEAMDARLAAIHAAMRSQRRADDPAGPAAAATAAPQATPPPPASAPVAPALAAASAAAPAAVPFTPGDIGWQDTEPMVGQSLQVRQQFADTMPADIEIELAAEPAPRSRETA
jgi:hypothetical protein